MAIDDVNQDFRALAARLSSTPGPGLFAELAQHLAQLLRASEVIIAEAVDELHARTLGVCTQGAIQPNYTFPLAGTPGEALTRSAPADEPAGDAEMASCFGLALHGADHRVIGFVSARGDQDLRISEHQQCLVEIISVLLTAELRLLRSERQGAALEQRAHRLQAELDALARSEVTAAATGLHPAPNFVSAALDVEDAAATGLHHIQREHILKILNATRWVIEGNAGAALKLGMKPATLRHRMKKLGIARVRPLT